MHSGHRYQMAQAGPLQGGGKRVGEVVPVARHQGPDKARHVLRKNDVDAVFYGFGSPGWEILGRNPVGALNVQPAVSLRPEKYPLGSIIGNFLSGKGAVPQGAVGDCLDPVAGAQPLPLFVCVQNSGYLHPALRLRLDQHRTTAVQPLLGPVRHRGRQADGLVVQVFRGLKENRHVEGRPQKARRQAGQNQHRPCPPTALPPYRSRYNHSRQGQRAAQGEQKRVQLSVDRPKNGGGKGEGKGGQYAHVLFPPPFF